MNTDPETGSPDDQNILVYLDDDQATPQPSSFRCCPLGIQLYAPREVEDYKLLELDFEVPGRTGDKVRINCHGVAVNCYPTEEKLFRVCVKFIDLPEETRDEILHLAHSTERLCPYCKNF